ncbi:MAG TPA: 1-acyl-sn-glycerol-3-phosphate acyltransferase, partial [Casimicrobiaceae bacterium]|nr:1-acyl-sn-glycerol-3-phosphate acyltransferase [Casimicrobiaceae bacterium]
MEAVVGDPEVRAAVQAQSDATGRPFDEVLREARECAEEIVPQYNARLHHQLAYRLARRIAKAAFRVRVGYLDDAILKDVSPEASVVFLINHRSNMDYVLVAFLTARYVAVSFAVGEWARVWPLEPLLRSLGGFFVRRNSHDALYRKILERYVHFAVERGVTQGVFPEGGLSKDGKLRPPKLGILSYATKHFARDSPRDVVFIPVGVNYDRVLEDRNLLRGLDPKAPKRSVGQTALTAARWVAKNLGLYARGRLYRFGYACVNFGAPISLRSYLRERGVDFSALEETARFEETERLGTLLMDEIAHVIPVTPVSLVASAILSFDGNEARRPALIGRVVGLMEELESLGAHIYVPRRDPEYLLNVGLRMLTLRRLIVRNGDLYHV